jgi:hypothetical protein
VGAHRTRMIRVGAQSCRLRWERCVLMKAKPRVVAPTSRVRPCSFRLVQPFAREPYCGGGRRRPKLYSIVRESGNVG